MRYIESITRKAVLSAVLNMSTDSYNANITIDWYPGSPKHLFLGDDYTHREVRECVLERINYRIKSIKKLSRHDFNNSLSNDVSILSLDVKTVDRYQERVTLQADSLISKSPRGVIKRVNIIPDLKYCIDISYKNELDNAVIIMGIGSELFDGENLDRTINPRKQYKLISFGYSIAHSLNLQIDALALKDSDGGVTISNFKRLMEVNVPYTASIEPPLNN